MPVQVLLASVGTNPKQKSACHECQEGKALHLERAGQLNAIGLIWIWRSMLRCSHDWVITQSTPLLMCCWTDALTFPKC